MIGELIVAGLIINSHPARIDSFAATHHTNVVTCGKVVYVKHETDGDWHFRITDGEHDKPFVVCEIMPQIPLSHPKWGDEVCVEGIRRFDDEVNHGWWEIHPVTKWEKK